MYQIESGSIALPDIQRPFVWKKTKVRDLFDSMYKSYPIGVLVFWETANQKTTPIGIDKKQNEPNLLVLDGQQRLTSLYAVIKNKKIVTKSYKEEFIKIAFNPQKEEFEVQDASHHKDRNFIPDISILWKDETLLSEVISNYLRGLGATEEVSKDTARKVEKAIQTLERLPISFSFTSIELTRNVDEADAADIFVRMNSQGQQLKATDFIFTLMSVYWEEGRSELEHIYRDSLQPPNPGGTSFYNELFTIKPDGLLRVAVALAFNRAQMHYAYRLLRGKNLETGEFTEKNRDKQFNLLKQAQEKVTNIQYWHNFLACIQRAGYVTNKMIIAGNSLVFCYILYLIGKTRYDIKEQTLRIIIARWFFMSNITGRYTSSPETAMEADLNAIGNIKSGEEFTDLLEKRLKTALPDSIWETTLPQDLLVRKGANSLAFHAYEAALVKLDARILFSDMKVETLLTSSKAAKKAAIERHHLFPKDYLKSNYGLEPYLIDQTANFTYVEWYKDIEISNTPPNEYVPQEKEECKRIYPSITDKEIEQMEENHALPPGWENMEYEEFLEKRRVLMARVIEKAYKKL